MSRRRGFVRAASRCVFVVMLMSLIGPGVRSAAAVETTVVSVGDASIEQDADAAVWSVSAGGAKLTLRLGADFDFQVTSLMTSSARQWMVAAAPDTTVTINDAAVRFGSRQDGFTFESAAGTQQGPGLQLDATFLFADTTLVTRHYFVVPGTPTFEVWTTIESLDGSPFTVANLNAFRISVPFGTVRWIRGLQGDNADVEHDSAFSLQSRSLASGTSLSFGSTRRSSETAIPYFAVDGSPDEFFGALLWSGAWSFQASRAGSTLALSLDVGSMRTQATGALDTPHAIFGVTRGGVWKATAAIGAFVSEGLRPDRPLTPLVTYNTWFAYGTEIDESSILAEMDRVAALGADLFVLDAGWYAGAGRNGPSDFDSGLGSWQVDTERFPQGLGALADHAHGLGMKFGLWVEPERINLETLGTPGLAEESWLAKSGGGYGSDHSAMICLSGERGLQWVQQQLFALLDAVQPDYLKWDNNLWVNCDREGHGHGKTDGNFSQTNGLYRVLAALRARYPVMLVENVAAGGNRLDLGMLRYSDAAWMDDRSTPSVHVRHNLEGLSQLFPPAYLLSFVMDGSEPLHDAADMSLMVRSRMAGALGLCFRTDGLTDADLGALGTEIGIYKAVQTVLSTASATMLSGQARAVNGPSWDVIEENSGQGQVLVLAFQSDTAVRKLTVKPSGLEGSTMYEVRSPDAGVMGVFKGSTLSGTGIDLLNAGSAAHVLVLTAR